MLSRFGDGNRFRKRRGRRGSEVSLGFRITLSDLWHGCLFSWSQRRVGFIHFCSDPVRLISESGAPPSMSVCRFSTPLMPRLHQITFVLGLLIALTEARSDEAPPRVWTGLGPERFSALVESFNAMED